MATRFRLPASGSPPVSPATQSYSHGGSTRRNLPTSDSSTLATTAVTPDGSDHLVAGDTFHAQFVSEPLGINTFVIGDGFDYAIQGLEAHTNNNLQVQIWIGLVSNDGATALATLRSKVLEGTELATSLTNRYYSGTLSGAYVTIGGERLVVEISVSGTPAAAGGVQGHNASLRFGGSGAGGDLPENDTSTGTTLNPWLEFANTINFLVQGDGVAQAQGQAVAAGAAIGEGAGSARAQSQAVAVGTSITVEARDGVAQAPSQATALGAAVASGAGLAQAPSEAVAPGSSTAEGTGVAEARSSAAAAGAATAEAAGAARSQAQALAAGASTAEGQGIAGQQAAASAEGAPIAAGGGISWAFSTGLAVAGAVEETVAGVGIAYAGCQAIAVGFALGQIVARDGVAYAPSQATANGVHVVLGAEIAVHSYRGGAAEAGSTAPAVPTAAIAKPVATAATQEPPVVTAAHAVPSVTIEPGDRG